VLGKIEFSTSGFFCFSFLVTYGGIEDDNVSGVLNMLDRGCMSCHYSL
jgi:hypothetical protein